jgi:hypothetical protein
MRFGARLTRVGAFTWQGQLRIRSLVGLLGVPTWLTHQESGSIRWSGGGCKKRARKVPAYDVCDKRHDRYLGAFFRKRWKGIYSFLNMNSLTTDHMPYRLLHRLFLHTHFQTLLLLTLSSPALLEAPIFLSPSITPVIKPPPPPTSIASTPSSLTPSPSPVRTPNPFPYLFIALGCSTAYSLIDWRSASLFGYAGGFHWARGLEWRCR